MSKTQTVSNAASAKPILAERFKTKACQKFDETGACPYEMRCMFAHGEHDLRTKEQNIADNLVTEEAIKAFQKARAIAAKSAQKKRERDEKRKAKRAAVSPAATPSDEEQEEAVAPVTAEELEEDVALPTQEEVSPVSVPTVSPSASPRKPSVTYDTTKFVSPLAAAMLSQRKVVSEECHCALCAAGEAHHDAAILLA